MADAVTLVRAGRTEYLGFLLWPVVPSPYSADGRSLIDALYRLTDFDVVSAYVLPVVVFLVLWVADGFPGYPSRSR